MSIVLQSSGGGSVTIQEPATASNFTATMPAATGTVVLTGTTPTLNGITFPATAVPSADANTLDDYEEGTWTPKNSSGNALTIAGTARYIKIGKMVWVSADISSLSQNSVYGLPFTVASGTSYSGTCCVGYNNYSAGINGIVNESADYITFYSGSTVITPSGSRLIIGSTYQAAN